MLRLQSLKKKVWTRLFLIYSLDVRAKSVYSFLRTENTSLRHGNILLALIDNYGKYFDFWKKVHAEKIGLLNWHFKISKLMIDTNQNSSQSVYSSWTENIVTIHIGNFHGFQKLLIFDGQL